MYPHLAQEFVDRISQNIDYRVYETNEVIIHGLKYKPRACLLTGWDNTQPFFAKIDKLFVYDYTKFAVCGTLERQTFQWVSNSFKIEETLEEKLVIFNELRNNWSLPIYECCRKKIVCNCYSHFGQGFFKK